MPRMVSGGGTRPAALLVAGLAILLDAWPAQAQTVYEADGGLNLVYDQAAPIDARSARLDVRPSLAIQYGSSRLILRVGYLFSGTLGLLGDESSGYSNHLSAALGATLSRRASLTVNGAVTQGSTYFRLTQPAPEATQPTLRPPTSLDLVAGTLQEVLAWEASPALRLGQSVGVQVTAARDEMDRPNTVVSASLGLDWLSPRDALGVTYAPRFAALRPLPPGDAPLVRTVTHSLQASWSHDFDQGWNGRAAAGVELLRLVPGPGATSASPTGTLSALYTSGALAGSLSLTHGAAPNLELGTMASTDQAILRGTLVLDPRLRRQVGASLGLVRLRPTGVEGVVTTTGQALEADVGVTWGLTEYLYATGRYSLSHQFGRADGAPSAQLHVFLLGLVVHFSNASYTAPVPSFGSRVDGADGARFPGDAPRP